MLAEIIQRTPIWVFILFFVLLVLGFQQSRNRIVSQTNIYILPIAMAVLSLYGVISAFGSSIAGLAFWCIGLVSAILIGLILKAPKGVTYSASDQSFSIPGSWLPMALMMAIFFTKYAVGVILARQLPIVNDTKFILIVSVLYGFFSGLFISRLLILRSAK